MSDVIDGTFYPAGFKKVGSSAQTVKGGFDPKTIKEPATTAAPAPKPSKRSNAT